MHRTSPIVFYLYWWNQFYEEEAQFHWIVISEWFWNNNQKSHSDRSEGIVTAIPPIFVRRNDAVLLPNCCCRMSRKCHSLPVVVSKIPSWYPWRSNLKHLHALSVQIEPFHHLLCTGCKSPYQQSDTIVALERLCGTEPSVWTTRVVVLSLGRLRDDELEHQRHNRVLRGCVVSFLEGRKRSRRKRRCWDRRRNRRYQLALLQCQEENVTGGDAADLLKAFKIRGSEIDRTEAQKSMNNSQRWPQWLHMNETHY